jgi:hypothetical protein
MNNLETKIAAQILIGVFSGVLLGIVGLIVGIDIGGNYGCLPFIDSLFGTRGYESCGAFAGILGMILGSVGGVLLINRLPIKNYYRLVWIFAILLVLPIIVYSFILLFGESDVPLLEFYWGLLKVLIWPVGVGAMMSVMLNWSLIRGRK